LFSHNSCTPLVTLYESSHTNVSRATSSKTENPTRQLLSESHSDSRPMYCYRKFQTETTKKKNLQNAYMTSLTAVVHKLAASLSRCIKLIQLRNHRKELATNVTAISFNLLVPELFFFLILAHPVYKMLINTGTEYVRIMK